MDATDAHESRISSYRREIHAPAARVFELIADPAEQPRWDGNDNLASAAPGQRITAPGQTFTTTLTGSPAPSDRPAERVNHVVEFAEGRLIAWKPSEPGAEPPGHLWRWEIEPLADDRCAVTHTYDWTELTDERRQERARRTTPDRLAASVDRLATLAESTR